MHWGRKRGTTQSTTKTRKRSDDVAIKDIVKTKTVSQMSNKEIKRFAERMQLEKQFKDLTKKEMSAGRKFVTDLLVSQAKEIATSYVKKHITKFLEKRTHN